MPGHVFPVFPFYPLVAFALALRSRTRSRWTRAGTAETRNGDAPAEPIAGDAAAEPVVQKSECCGEAVGEETSPGQGPNVCRRPRRRAVDQGREVREALTWAV